MSWEALAREHVEFQDELDNIAADCLHYGKNNVAKALRLDGYKLLCATCGAVIGDWNRELS